MKELGEDIVNLGKSIIDSVTILRSLTPIFDSDFIYKQNVYVKYIRKECAEVRHLLYAYDIDIDAK